MTMFEPSPMSSETPAEQQAWGRPPAPPRRWRIPALSVAAGLVVGAGAVGLVWGLSGASAGTPPGADAEVSAACTAIRGVAAPTTGNLDVDTARRWNGAGDLAVAAGHSDPRYAAFGDAFGTVQQSVEQLTLDSDYFTSALATVRSTCAGLH
jgi:hypothetical protein